MNVENLTTFEKDTLLRWFLYYMPMGTDDRIDGSDTTKATRMLFMREYPEMYNRLAGRPVVCVIHRPTNTPV